MPTYAKTKTFASGESPIASADLNSIGNDVASFLNTTKIDSDNIQDLGITAGKLAGSIGASKLSATTPGYVLLGLTTTGVPTFTAFSGDITVTGGGVTAIGAGKVTNAMLAGSITEAKITAGTLTTASLSATAGITSGQLAGSIAYNKLATLNTGQILAGNAGTPTATTLGGDATIGATGTLTVANNAITAAKINANAVTPAKIDSTAFVGSNTSTDSSPASAGNTTVATASVTPAVASYLLLFWSGRIQSNGSGHWGRLFITVDGSEQTAIGDAYFQNNTASVQVVNAAAVGRISLTAAAHTINLVYTPDGGSNTAISGAKLWGVLVAQ